VESQVKENRRLIRVRKKSLTGKYSAGGEERISLRPNSEMKGDDGELSLGTDVAQKGK